MSCMFGRGKTIQKGTALDEIPLGARRLKHAFGSTQFHANRALVPLQRQQLG